MGNFGNSGGRPSRPQSFEKPVKEGAEYDVVINEVGAKGDGIARVQGFVLFVTGAKQGEKIRVKITRLMRNFAIAEKIGPSTSAGGAEAPKAEEKTEEQEEEGAEEEKSKPENEGIEEISEEDYSKGAN